MESGNDSATISSQSIAVRFLSDCATLYVATRKIFRWHLIEGSVHNEGMQTMVAVGVRDRRIDHGGEYAFIGSNRPGPIRIGFDQ